MIKRHMTIREEYVLTLMTENLFKGLAQIMADGDVRQLGVCPDREIKAFGRICLAFLEGKDIMFSNLGNKETFDENTTQVFALVFTQSRVS